MDPRAFRRPAEQSRRESADRAFDPKNFDFAAYLGRRLGIDVGLASELLGEWLRTYEPVDLAGDSRSLARDSASPPSGPRVTKGLPHTLLTGTEG